MKKNIKSKFVGASIVWICFFIIYLSSCKKYVLVNPPVTQIVGSVVFTNNTSAAAAMSGVYDAMMNGSGNLSGGTASISFECGLMADELTNYNSGNIVNKQFYTNTLTSSSNGASNYYFWALLYSRIHQCDAVLEGLSKSTGVSSEIKQQLTGEAKFMRAYLHLYAVNLYGDVPLILTTDYLTNNSIKRTPKIQVYQQIVQDLTDAKVALSDNFVDASGLTTTERIRPNKSAATALLARAYLYFGDLNHDPAMYKAAEDQATAVINNTAQYSLTSDLNQTFLANSPEAIWQLQPVNPVLNTYDGFYFVLQSAPGTQRNPVALSSSLVNSFEAGDKRFTNWVDTISSGGVTYYYPFKYKVYTTNQPLTEYLMVLRLAEQYLIRAEARAEQGESNAIDDLNVIRHRAGLLNYAGTNDRTGMLSAIMRERRVEMFTEWGHRWLDLKRTGTVDAVLSVVTPTKGGGAWNPNKALMPLPLGDLQADQNLTQNPGY